MKKLWIFLTFFCGITVFAGISAFFRTVATEGAKAVPNFILGLICIPLTILCAHKLLQPARHIPESRVYNPGAPLPIVSSGTLFLSPGEVCHINESAKSGKLKTITTGYTGGSAGVSVRVAKGLTLHSGSTRGTPVRKSVMDTSGGTFYVTNKRIVMISPKYGFDKPLSSISGIKMYTDGFSIQAGSSHYTILLKEPLYVANVLIAAAHSGPVY